MPLLISLRNVPLHDAHKLVTMMAQCRICRGVLHRQDRISTGRKNEHGNTQDRTQRAAKNACRRQLQEPVLYLPNYSKPTQEKRRSWKGKPNKTTDTSDLLEITQMHAHTTTTSHKACKEHET